MRLRSTTSCTTLLFPDPGRIDPRDVYLRALLELHPPQPDAPGRASRPTGLDLAPFQRDGYERARVIARDHGGVIYADGVGTGKTEIGLAFIEERTKESGVFALVVTPAQLKGRWQERIHQAKLSAQVISFQELASDEQLVPDAHQPRRHLDIDKDSYRLVLVDEAHALRNEDTTWYRAMERLLGGTSKQVGLLTATPINNGLWDLYNLVMLFARHDRAFGPIGIDSVREALPRRRGERARPREPQPRCALPPRRRGQRAPRSGLHRTRLQGRELPRRNAGAIPEAEPAHPSLRPRRRPSRPLRGDRRCRSTP